MRNLATAIASAMALSVCASAQTDDEAATALLDGSDPSRIADLINGMGYNAVLDDGSGNIRVTVSGLETSLFLDHCVENETCGVAVFTVGFDLSEGIEPARIAEWNATNLFGQAYLDENNDPFIDMAVNLNYGVSEANFRDTMGWWDAVVTRYAAYVGF